LGEAANIRDSISDALAGFSRFVSAGSGVEAAEAASVFASFRPLRGGAAGGGGEAGLPPTPISIGVAAPRFVPGAIAAIWLA